MPNPRDNDLAQLDTWITEDIQIRKVHYLNDPDTLALPATTATTTTTTTAINTPTLETLKPTVYHHIRATTPQTLEKEQAALRAALNLSRQQQHEADRQAMLLEQQRKMEGSFRERKKMREREQAEFERDMAERERERELLSIEFALERDRETKAAALRRVVAEEEAWRVRREEEKRVLWEQLERERELKVQGERERTKVKDLEEAAVARAVEESIISEVARKVVEREKRGRERRRVEAAAERMRLEAEAKAQEERLRRRVEGKKGSEWSSGGMKTAGYGRDLGLHDAAVPLLGPRVGEVRAFADGDLSPAPYPPTTRSYSTSYTNGSRGSAPLSPVPTWYRYTQPLMPRASSRGDTSDNNTQDSRLWDRDHRGLDLDAFGESGSSGWRNTRKAARRWRETTTERWETVIHGEDEGHDGYRRYKEISQSTRGFL